MARLKKTIGRGGRPRAGVGGDGADQRAGSSTAAVARPDHVGDQQAAQHVTADRGDRAGVVAEVDGHAVTRGNDDGVRPPLDEPPYLVLTNRHASRPALSCTGPVSPDIAGCNPRRPRDHRTRHADATQDQC